MPVGYVRAASYGHTLGGAVGLAMVAAPEHVDTAWLDEGEWEVDVAGVRHRLTVSLRPLYDPKSERVRMSATTRWQRGYRAWSESSGRARRGCDGWWEALCGGRPVLACSTAMAATMFVGGVAAHAATSPNLIKNGGAGGGRRWHQQHCQRAELDSHDGQDALAVKYGTPRGFPTTSSPGPSTRGKNFFAGGSDNTANEIATQTISLASFATKIKGGAVTATAAGWFGGFSSQTDNASLVVTFKNSSGAVVATMTAGPVTAPSART